VGKHLPAERMRRIAAPRNGTQNELLRRPISRSSVDEVLIRRILGSPGRSKSQQLATESRHGCSNRGVAEG